MIKAEKYGITIGMENTRPYLDGSPYCYAESLEKLFGQVEQINHPREGITLDVGHAFLASCYSGFNLLEQISLAAPYIRHIHLHDNYGKPSTSLEKKQAEMLAMGRGDLHLPVGWGEIPANEIFDILRNYTGVVTHEIRPRYHKWASEALSRGRQLVIANADRKVPGNERM